MKTTKNYQEYIHHYWNWHYHRTWRGERVHYDFHLKIVLKALIFIAKIDQYKLRTTKFFSTVSVSQNFKTRKQKF